VVSVTVPYGRILGFLNRVVVVVVVVVVVTAIIYNVQ
jgi:hypothetical protein